MKLLFFQQASPNTWLLTSAQIESSMRSIFVTERRRRRKHKLNSGEENKIKVSQTTANTSWRKRDKSNDPAAPAGGKHTLLISEYIYERLRQPNQHISVNCVCLFVILKFYIYPPLRRNGILNSKLLIKHSDKYITFYWA